MAGAFASRAIASPIRLAAEPPLARIPPKPGQPTASAIHDTTVRSIVAAAGDDRQAARFWFNTEAKKSARAPTGSPEPKTYPKKRPLPARECAATSSRSSNAAAPRPSTGAGAVNNSAASAPVVCGRMGRASISAR